MRRVLHSTLAACLLLPLAARAVREPTEVEEGWPVTFTADLPAGWEQRLRASFGFDRLDPPQHHTVNVRVGRETEEIDVETEWSSSAGVHLAIIVHGNAYGDQQPIRTVEELRARVGDSDEYRQEAEQFQSGRVSVGGHNGVYFIVHAYYPPGPQPATEYALPGFSGGGFNFRAYYAVTVGRYQVKIDAEGRGGWTVRGGDTLLEASDGETAALRETLDRSTREAYTRTRADVDGLIASLRLEAPGPTAAVSGRVTVPDLADWRGGAVLPLIEVPVILLHNKQEVARTFTDIDGRYKLASSGRETDLSLRVVLEHGLTTPAYFRVVHDREPSAVQLETKPFSIPEGTTGDHVVDISFAPGPSVTAARAHLDKLIDCGLIYAYAQRAATEATVMLRQVLDNDLPLDIHAFESLTESACFAGTYSCAPSQYEEAKIRISRAHSQAAAELAADTVYHEFGHALMADAYGNLYPVHDLDVNHAGYLNPSTCDSWGEGFATFYAMLTSRDVAHEGDRAHLYGREGWPIDMEVNWRATSGLWTTNPVYSREEYAVAGLLWDLVDPADEHDASPMLYDPQTFTNMGVVLPANPPPVRLVYYRDRIEITATRLWEVISAMNPPDPSPVASVQPQGFDYIFDVKQLYETLRAAGIGAQRTSLGMSALDELFVAHGFFADTSPQNFCYDQGETIGLTGTRAFSWYAHSLTNRAARRSPPPVDNSYLLLRGRDRVSGKAVALRRFEVEVDYDPPYDSHDISFEAVATSADRVHFMPADYGIPVRYRIRPVGAAPGTAPLVVTGGDWWEKRRTGEVGAFAEHEFEVDAGRVPAEPAPPSGGDGVDGRVVQGLVSAVIGAVVAGFVVRWLFRKKR